MRGAGRHSSAAQELLDRETDVSRDLPKKRGRNIATRVKRDRRTTAIWMAILPVRASLPDLHKAQALQQGRDFEGLEDRQRSHGQATRRV